MIGYNYNLITMNKEATPDMTTETTSENGNENSEVAPVQTEEKSSKGFTLDGESWKARKSETYVSILDMYEARDLFTEENTEKYARMNKKQAELDDTLRDYVFVSKEKENIDAQLVDMLFSEEVKISNTRNYNENLNSNTILYVFISVLVIMIFTCFMVKFNLNRRKKREKYASEINMESL